MRPVLTVMTPNSSTFDAKVVCESHNQTLEVWTFLTLTPEIRCIIYEILFKLDIILRIHPQRKPELSSQILRVCQTIYHEVQPLLYGKPTFGWSCCLGNNFLCGIRQNSFAAIRHLILQSDSLTLSHYTILRYSSSYSFCSLRNLQLELVPKKLEDRMLPPWLGKEGAILQLIGEKSPISMKNWQNFENDARLDLHEISKVVKLERVCGKAVKWGNDTVAYISFLPSSSPILPEVR